MSKLFAFADSARTWRRVMAAGFVLAATAVGCGEDADDVSGASEPDTLSQAAAPADWCAVKKIMDKSCVFCHDGQGTAGSPMGLAKPEDFHVPSPLTPGKKVFETVQARMNNRQRPMPPRGVLPAADLAVIDQWVAAGAPGTCGGAAAPDAGAATTADAGGLDAGTADAAVKIDAAVKK
jgi:hypothetical protein